MGHHEADGREEPGGVSEQAAAEALERGRLLFARECRFLRGVRTSDQLPEPEHPEVAFAGRSNVGKSSLLNALTGRKTLARTSNTPGRTQEINFFLLDERLCLVDLPGYGYARASKGEIGRWNRLIEDYLRGRPNLKRVCVLIDARHGLKPSDEVVMASLDKAAVSYQAVLTKADKAGPDELERIVEGLAAALRKRPAAHPEIIATSVVAGSGVAELRAELATFADHAV
jgi:GTP-binding protein